LVRHPYLGNFHRAKVLEEMEKNMMNYKEGGVPKGMHRMPDGKMMKDSAHDDKKKDAPMMQKVAARAVKGHEKRMHTPKKMAHGGSIDGCAVKGKTRGRLV
jgi:hypothetical protein